MKKVMFLIFVLFLSGCNANLFDEAEPERKEITPEVVEDGGVC